MLKIFYVGHKSLPWYVALIQASTIEWTSIHFTLHITFTSGSIHRNPALRRASGGYEAALQLTESEPSDAQRLEEDSLPRKRRCTRHSGEQSTQFKSFRVAQVLYRVAVWQRKEFAKRFIHNAEVSYTS